MKRTFFFPLIRTCGYLPGVKRPTAASHSDSRRKIPNNREERTSSGSSENEDDGISEKRHFCSRWKDMFAWIVYDEQKDFMFCSLCKKLKKKQTSLLLQALKTFEDPPSVIIHKKQGSH